MAMHKFFVQFLELFLAPSTLALRADYSFLTCSNSPDGRPSATTTEQKAAPAFPFPRLKVLLGSFVVACTLMIASLPPDAFQVQHSKLQLSGHQRSTHRAMRGAAHRTLPTYFQFAQFKTVSHPGRMHQHSKSANRLKHCISTRHASCKGVTAWFL